MTERLCWLERQTGFANKGSITWTLDRCPFGFYALDYAPDSGVFMVKRRVSDPWSDLHPEELTRIQDYLRTLKAS